MSINGGFLTKANAKEARVSAVITRADGSVEDLGTIAYWHKNPLRRLLWSLLDRIKRSLNFGRTSSE